MRERMTAIRASIADIVEGQYDDEEGPRVVSPYGVELRRVALIGFIVAKYIKDDKSYASLTLDDGSETIQAKAWGAEAAKLEEVTGNHLSLTIGKIRKYGDEIYIAPEIVRPLDDGNYMTLHILERLKAILTRSGVSYLESDSEDKSGSQLRIENSTNEHPPKKGKSKRRIVGELSAEILEYIREEAKDEGVSIEAIADAFKEKGHDKSVVQLKVIDLLESEYIRETKLGIYEPLD